MDPRRFDTRQLMARGILETPVPETEIPRERESLQYAPDGYGDIGTEDEIREAVDG